MRLTGSVSRLARKARGRRGRKHVGCEVLCVTPRPGIVRWHSLGILCMPRRKSLLATLTCSFLDSLFGRLHSTFPSFFLADSPFFKGFLPRKPLSAGAEIWNYNGDFRAILPFSWRSNSSTRLRSIDFLFFRWRIGNILTLLSWTIGLLDRFVEL